MSQLQAPAAAADVSRVDTENYRSIWMYLKELEFRQGFVDIGVNGVPVRTRFAEAGDPDKPHAILLHGTGGHWETFAPNLAALSQHFHCVAIDMVGNGFSDKPDYDYEIAVYVEHVLGVMDHFGMASANFIAMSLGAFVASAVSVGHAERVHVAQPDVLGVVELRDADTDLGDADSEFFRRGVLTLDRAVAHPEHGQQRRGQERRTEHPHSLTASRHRGPDLERRFTDAQVMTTSVIDLQDCSAGGTGRVKP